MMRSTTGLTLLIPAARKRTFWLGYSVPRSSSGLCGDDKKLWVNAIYLELTGGSAPDAEEARCLQQLADGISMTDVVLGITSSQDYASNLGQQHFQQYLGRPASAAEIAHWMDDMQTGVSEEQVLAGILNLPEFHSLAGNTDKGWLNAVYTHLLNRSANADEEGHCLRMLGHAQE